MSPTSDLIKSTLHRFFWTVMNKPQKHADKWALELVEYLDQHRLMIVPQDRDATDHVCSCHYKKESKND